MRSPSNRGARCGALRRHVARMCRAFDDLAKCIEGEQAKRRIEDALYDLGEPYADDMTDGPAKTARAWARIRHSRPQRAGGG
jgi:hypothetical protein